MSRKILFVDMDGTLCEFSVNGNILPPDTDWETPGYFVHRRPLAVSIDKLIRVRHQFPRTLIVILTAVPSKIGQEEKLHWLEDYGLDRYTDHIVFVDYPNGNKAKMLEYVCAQNNWDVKDALLIDDDLKILFDAQARGIDVMHVSTFLTRSAKEIVKRP